MEEKQYFFIKDKSAIIKINNSEVNSIEALGDYVQIYTKKKIYTTHHTLGSVDEKLKENGFIRIHRSVILHFSNILRVENNIIYTSEKAYPIGGNYINSIMEKLNIL